MEEENNNPDIPSGLSIEFAKQLWGNSIDSKFGIDVSIKPESTAHSSSFVPNIELTTFTISYDKNSPEENSQYTLIARLGQGGMGIVYRAHQHSMDRNVALKTILPEKLGNQGKVISFLTEAVVTGNLDHPNIMPVYDVGYEQNGHPFYSMKEITGQSWQQVIKQKSERENLDILLAVCDAMAYSHDQGVIHRDLKPENVMIGEYGEVVVVDWGLAAGIGDAAKHKAEPLTEQSSYGGTAAYMAPEMAACETERIGPASDIYLLGGILYYITTGLVPHDAGDVFATLYDAMANVIQPMDRDDELVKIALEAMSTNPEERFSSVKEFKNVISAYLKHAESIKLANSALRELDDANKSGDYVKYASALYGFKEAWKLWADNKTADFGIAKAAYDYACNALNKGDLDLAESLLMPEYVEHSKLAAEIAKAKQMRIKHKKRLKFYTYGSAGLAVIIILILSVGFVIVKKAENQATAARDKAEESMKRAVEAESKTKQLLTQVRAEKDKAVAAEKTANIEREKALKAEKKAKGLLASVKAEKNKAVAAEKTANKERAKAVEAERTAKELLAEVEQERDRTKEALRKIEEEHKKVLTAKQETEKVKKIAGTEKIVLAEDANAAKYKVTLETAYRAIKDADIQRAKTVLESTNPKNRGCLWQALMNKCLPDLTLPLQKPYERIAVSNDGRYAFLYGRKRYDSAIYIDVMDISRRKIVNSYTDTATGVKKYPDIVKLFNGTLYFNGKQLLKLNSAGKFVSANTKSGSRKVVYSTPPYYSQIISYDGKLAAMTTSNTITIVNPKTGEKISTLHTKRAGGSAMAFSPNGKLFVTGNGAMRGEIAVWSVATGIKVKDMGGSDQCGRMAYPIKIMFSKTGNKVLTICRRSGRAQIWDMGTNKKILTLGKHYRGAIKDEFICDASFTDNDAIFALKKDNSPTMKQTGPNSYSSTRLPADYYISLYKSKPDFVLIPRSNKTTCVLSHYISHDSKYIISGFNPTTGLLRKVNIATGKITESILPEKYRSSTCMHMDISQSNLLFSQYIWNTRGGDVYLSNLNLNHFQTLHLKNVFNATFSPNGKQVIAIEYNTWKVIIYDIALNRVVRSFTPFDKTVKNNNSGMPDDSYRFAIFSNTGRYIATTIFNCNNKGRYECTIWDARTLKQIKTFTMKGSSAISAPLCTFSQDDKMIALNGLDAMVYTLPGFRKIFTSSDEISKGVASSAFSLDKTLLFTVIGGIGKAWNLHTGREIFTFNNSKNTGLTECSFDGKTTIFVSQESAGLGVNVWYSQK